jgi:hypothetical protein
LVGERPFDGEREVKKDKRYFGDENDYRRIIWSPKDLFDGEKRGKKKIKKAFGDENYYRRIHWSPNAFWKTKEGKNGSEYRKRPLFFGRWMYGRRP